MRHPLKRLEWEEIRSSRGWEMPPARLWKRLPLIRHIRAGLYIASVRSLASVGGVSASALAFAEWHGLGIALGMEGAPSVPATKQKDSPE